MSRKALSKKLRFEVFKRDSFTCQYCGDKAPDIILECDHIIPVAVGDLDDNYMLTASGRMNLRKIIRRFGFDEAFTSAQISIERYYDGSANGYEETVNKIGGICYNRKHGRTAGGG